MEAKVEMPSNIEISKLKRKLVADPNTNFVDVIIDGKEGERQLQYDDPLETPLTPKRKRYPRLSRKRNPPPDFKDVSDEPSTSAEPVSSTHNILKSMDSTEQPSATSVTIVFESMDFSEHPIKSPIPSPVSDFESMDSAEHPHMPQVQSPVNIFDSMDFAEHPIKSPIPSPVTSEIGEESGYTIAPLNTFQVVVKKEKVDSTVNYGSDDDSDVEEDNDEELTFPVFVPRMQRSLFEDMVISDPLAPVEVKLEPKPEPEPVAMPPPLTYEPTGLFNFEWRRFPNPPVPPNERREVFSVKECGPTTQFLTPYDAFIAIWSRDFVEYIARETNKYAQQVTEKQIQDGTLKLNSRITHWQDTDADELYVYFALVLNMGMCIKSDIAEYWSKGDVSETPIFGHFMPLNRFLLISKCLHFVDNESTDVQTLIRSEAKLFKIAPVINHLNAKFQSLYRLSRSITLDESLTQWQRGLNIKQYIKTEVASVGIKTYEICEAKTGYLWRFKAHTGQNKMTPFSDAIPNLVLELLNGLENKGHTVSMDSYYNSPYLARVLKSRGFDCVGTLRTTAQGVPPQLAALPKANMEVGQISGCTSGDVDILVWRDQNRVAAVSTYHGATVHTALGKTKPLAIHDYNVSMGGVDRKDQMLSAYPLERKRTHVWYKKLFRRLLNVSVLNSFILHKHSSLHKNRSATSISNHRNFRKILINQILLEHHRRPVLGQERSCSEKIKGRIAILTEQVLEHFPIRYGYLSMSKKERYKRTCVVCHKRVPTYCPKCNVPLCAFDCIKTFHGVDWKPPK